MQSANAVEAEVVEEAEAVAIVADAPKTSRIVELLRSAGNSVYKSTVIKRHVVETVEFPKQPYTYRNVRYVNGSTQDGRTIRFKLLDVLGAKMEPMAGNAYTVRISAMTTRVKHSNAEENDANGVAFIEQVNFEQYMAECQDVCIVYVNDAIMDNVPQRQYNRPAAPAPAANADRSATVD